VSAEIPSSVLELRGVRRVFRQAGTELVVLNGIDLVLRPGEIVALVGPSGAGKSTMLHIAGLLERPDGGAVLIGGQDCARLNDERRTLLRRSEIGFVYQFHHLLPEFSALENVMLPQMIAAVPRRQAQEKAAGLLDHATGESVLETLLDLVRNSGLSALIATHNLDLARRLDRIVGLADGRLRTFA